MVMCPIVDCWFPLDCYSVLLPSPCVRCIYGRSGHGEGNDTCVLSTRTITEGFWKCLLLMLKIEVTVFTDGYLHSQSNTQVLVCETILCLELDLRAVTGLLSHVSVFCTYNHNALL